MKILSNINQYIKHYLKRIKFILSRKGFFNGIFYSLYHIFFVITQNIYSKTIRIKNNKVFIITSSKNFECNPKYIAINLHEKNKDLQINMLTKSTKNYDYLPDYIKCVNLGEFSLTKELASSKIIIDNGTGLSYLHYKKKRNQYLIQTWHGSIGIKKFSKETNSDVRWIKKAEKEAKMTDFIISNSTFETEQVYKATFWKNTPIWEYGHPRNDILFQKTDTKLKEFFYNKYNIPISNKLCLYAPTFRDTKSFEYYNIDYKAVKEALNKKFGGEFTIITRFHLHLRSLLSSQKLDNNTIDVSDYPDIMEILTFIDCGITDYSSWICEYMLSRKPGFLYAPDLEEYQTNERAFFYPLSDLPFLCSTSNEQLIRNIELFDEITFKNKCDSFLNIMKCFDDGKASDRTATSILELLAK